MGKLYGMWWGASKASRALWRSLSTRRKFIVLLAFLLLAVGDLWGLPSEVTTAFDASSVYSSLGVLTHFREAAFDYAYPQVHKILLLPVVGLVMVVTLLLGGMGRPTGAWPYGLSHPVATITALFLAGILVSNLMAITALALAATLGDDDRDDTSWGFSLLFLAACGPFAYYARTMNYDYPYLFWWALAWLLLWRAVVDGQPTRKNLLLSGVFAALAVGAKDQAAGLAVGAAAAVLTIPGDVKTRMQRGLTWGSAAAATYALVVLVSPPGRWWYHVTHMDETLVGAGRADPSQYPLSQLAADVAGSLSAVLSWPALALAGVGLFLLLRRRDTPRLAAILLPLGGYALAPILSTRVGHVRFLMPVALLLVPALLVAVQAAQRRSRTWATLGLGALLAWRLAFSWVPMAWLQTFDAKRSLAADLATYVPPGEVLCYFDEYRLIPNADVYTRYKLWRPGLSDVSRPAQHIFLPVEPAQTCRRILTVIDHGPTWQGLPRVRTWGPPEWLQARIAAGDVFEPSRSVFAYYLYQN